MGRSWTSGFTSTFTPNTKVLCVQSGESYDVDWTNQRDGRSSTENTYAAVTARSFHPGGVSAVYMDGSVRFQAETIDLQVWRALSTRAGGEVVSDQ